MNKTMVSNIADALMKNADNGYKCFYNGKSIDVYAKTSLDAQNQAAKLFKCKKAYQVTVCLCETANKQVTSVITI